jgi:low temperature requirement protein LtrA
LLVVAGFLDGWTQGMLWAVALAIDYGGPLLFGVAGFRIHAGHFVERHGLIIIIALGESIVAIGVGAAGLGLGSAVIAAACLGIAVAAALWWAYFVYVVLLAERRLSEAGNHERARLARDSYSYLHLPMVAGIVFLALGVKNTLAHVGDPLGTIPASALCGGVALYLLGHNAFRLRDIGDVSVPRLVVAGLSCALVTIGVRIPALLTLGILAALLAALVAFETLYWREERSKLRKH